MDLEYNVSRSRRSVLIDSSMPPILRFPPPAFRDVADEIVNPRVILMRIAAGDSKPRATPRAILVEMRIDAGIRDLY